MCYAIVTSDNDFFRECYGTLWNFSTYGTEQLCYNKYRESKKETRYSCPYLC